MIINPTNANTELLSRLQAEAILYADEGTRIVGRSGRPAPWMFYCWPLTMTGSGAALVAEAMLARIADFEASQLAAFGVGAVPLLTACLMRSDAKHTGLTIRSEAKRYGSCRQIEGNGNGSGKVIIVDDSINSGTSLMTAIRVLEEAGYDVEGAVCLAGFSFGGGVEYLQARGYRVEVLFDVWDDLKMPRPTRSPLYLRHMPARWAQERVPEGLHPALVARAVAEHLLATGDVLQPPDRFDENEIGPGGVWVSFRRRDNDRRLAREGFWHFDPNDADPTRDVVIASAATARALGGALTPEALAKIKIAISFFSELEPVALRDLDFRRYGIVVRSRHIPAKMGGALPNTQLFTSSFEQYQHARVTNAHIGRFEPHQVFRHDVRKRIEPGHRWPAYGEDEAILDAWTRAPGLGDALVRRALSVIEAEAHGDSLPPVMYQITRDRVSAVAVSLYHRGLMGCAVAGTGTIDEMLVDATRHALQDERFARRRAEGATPSAVTVSLLHDRERHPQQDAQYVAWKMRAGRDSLSVYQLTPGANRWAVFLDSVVPHYSWTKQQTAERLLRKAGIESGPVEWVTYKTVAWCGGGGSVYELESGARRRTADASLRSGDVATMAAHLRRRLDDAGWPASRVLCHLGSYERRGTAARCIHALCVLREAASFCGRGDWNAAAQRGLDHALRNLEGGSHPTRSLRDHTCGPIAEAMLLGAAAATGDPSRVTRRVHELAARVHSFVRPDGSVRPEGALPSTTDADYLPGITLLGLARYCHATGQALDIDWAGVRAWYTRRFRLLHPWGLASWHCQVWPLVAVVTGDDRHVDFSFEMADWMVERQLHADGSFLTDMCATGPSWHTACAALGIAAAWRAAAWTGDATRAQRYRQSWHEAMRFLDRLTVRAEDAYWMPKPEIAVGGVRATAASFEMRIDSTSESLQALLHGLMVEHNKSARDVSIVADSVLTAATD